MTPIALELLSPARDAETGRTAIDCGADAVYIGPPAFGARASAGNSIDDIASLATYAHRFGARVYATMNTIVLDNELEKARLMALELCDAGIDALIVQDMAYLDMNLPVALHASTQCDIRTPRKARWLAKAGFTRLVLPREFDAARIREAVDASGVPAEVFIHGARCVSYSGDCQIGYVATGRSANRGMCPQMCRLPFDIVDEHGSQVAPKAHYLSLADLRTPDIGPLVEAGARSFKIEGRLKDRRYVANATAWYSAMLDGFISRTGSRYCRASAGTSDPGFIPDIDRGFFRRPNGGGLQATLGSPKDTGVAVGKVSSPYNRRNRCFSLAGSALGNGDGLGFFDSSGAFHGFRLNRADGTRCFPAEPLPELTAGTTIFRNSDKEFNDSVDHARARRLMRLDFTLDVLQDGNIELAATDERGFSASTVIDRTIEPARTDPRQHRRSLLERLGDEPYRIGGINDNAAAFFIAASVLADTRRKLLAKLASDTLAGHRPEKPGKNVLESDAFANGPGLTYHDNVANRAAGDFYRSHGADIIRNAIECGTAGNGELQVMSTRYCIRAELGACLRKPESQRLPARLFLRNESGLYRLEFDCANCGMKVFKVRDTKEKF